MKSGCVYLMANHRRGQTYLGSTSNLPQRAYRHGLAEGHSKEKGCQLLVWYQYFNDMQEARACERRMKKWKRDWKLRTIEEQNPDWRDLFDNLFALGQRSGLRRSTTAGNPVLRRMPERCERSAPHTKTAEHCCPAVFVRKNSKR